MYKWFYRLLSLTLIIGFFLRVFQYYTVIDCETGYFKNTPFSHAVSIYLIFAAALFIILLYAAPKTKSADAAPASFFYTPSETFVLCVCAVFGVVTAFASPGRDGFLGFLMGLFLAGSAAAFIFLRVSPKQAKYEIWHKLLLLSPVLYYIMKLVFTFEAYTQVANISSYMLTLFSFGFLALFLMSFAKFVFQKGSKKTLFFLGGMALSGLPVSALPALAVSILGFAYNMEHSIVRPLSQLFDLAVGIFILMTLRKLSQPAQIPGVSDAAGSQKDYTDNSEYPLT